MKNLTHAKFLSIKIDENLYKKFGIYALGHHLDFNTAIINLIKRETDEINIQETPIPESDLYYLAGIVDGDGSLSIVKEKKRDSYSPIIKVSMTDIDIVEHLSNTLGGTIRPRTRKDRVNGHIKQQYYWDAQNNKAVRIAELLYPFLLTYRRKQSAKNIIEFGHTINGNRLSVSDKFIRDQLHEDTKRNNIMGHIQAIVPTGNTSKHYLGGIFDAEGCATIVTTKSGRSINRMSSYLQIKMTDFEPILAFHKTYGGMLYEGNNKKQENHKKYLFWRTSGALAGSIAEELLQFCRGKRKRECLSYICQYGKTITNKNKRIPSDIRQFRLQLYTKCQGSLHK